MPKKSIKKSKQVERRCRAILPTRRKCPNRFISGANRLYCSQHSGTKLVRDQVKAARISYSYHKDSDYY
jgi:hypothetical protein